MQRYFIGDCISDDLNARCGIHTDIKVPLLPKCWSSFHDKYNLVRLFYIAIDMMPTDALKVVILADKSPAGEHVLHQ